MVERKPGTASVMQLFLLVALQLFHSCHANGGYMPTRKEISLRRRMDEATDDLINNSGDDDTATRLLIQPFAVQLTGASEDFSSSDLNALYLVMSQVVSDYVVTTKQTANVAYLLLGDISSSLSDTGTTELNLNTGALKLDGASDMDETTLSSWVAEAIDLNYVAALQDTPYSYVTAAKYAGDGATGKPNDGETPTDDKGDDQTSGIVDQPAATVSNSKTGVIAGSCAAAATLVGLLAILLVSRTKKQSKVAYIEQQNSKDDSLFFDPSSKDLQNIFVPTGSDEEKRQGNSPTGLTLALSQLHQGIVSNSSGLSTSTASSTEHSGPSPAMQIVAGKPGILGAAPMVLDDGKSLDGHESDFTVNTEAGDSTAVKSMTPQKLYHPANIFTNMERESFERDRQVCIRKDMMTSTWSGGTQHPQPPQNESVLEPSHLTASQARQERRPREDDLLVFEQANHDTTAPNAGKTPPSMVSRMTRYGDVV